MQQIQLIEPFQLRMDTVPDPVPQAGQALVQVRRIGICGTDLHAVRGRQPFFTYPRVLGHELAVEIVDIGENGQGLQPGDECVVFPYFACGTCIACRRGKTNCCTQMQVLGVHVDGGMCEFMALSVDRLLPAAGLTAAQMALVENQCIGAHAVCRSGLTATDTALVVGAGPIGLGVVQFAQNTGARVIVTDIVQSKLDFCRTHLGIEHALPTDQDLPARLAALTDGDLPTVVFDATGHPDSMQNGFDLVAHGGTYVLVSLVQAHIRFWDPEFHKREISLLASRNATRDNFAQVIAAIQHKAIAVDPLITHTAPFAQVISHFDTWLNPETGVIKAMACL